MEIQWCVSLSLDAFRIIHDIDIAVEVCDHCDGDAYGFTIEAIWIEGERYDGAPRPAETRRSDLLSENRVDAFWQHIGERIKRQLLADDGFAGAVAACTGWTYAGRGANDPDGRYLPVR